MKYLKKFKLFESEEIMIGWRAQNHEKLHPSTGEKATEGEGYYIFDEKKEAEDWYDAKYIFEIKYTKPKKEIHVDFLGEHNSFLFWGESDDLFKPIKKKDNEWIKLHKLAIQHGGEDLAKCIKEFTRLDHSLIISSTMYENPIYKLDSLSP